MTIRPSINRVWASQAASSNIQDPDTFVPNKVATGWEAEIPPFQWFNWIQNRNDLFKLALAERGVAEWGSDVAYEIHSLAYSEGHIWVSTQANQGVEPVEGQVWHISSAEITQENLDDLKARIEAHIARVNNPHSVSASQTGAYSKEEADDLVGKQATALDDHTSDFQNPHKVTAELAGGVPITGGTYEGAVDIEADTFTIAKGKTPKPFGLVRSGDDVFLSTTDDKLGIKGGKPVFVSGTTVNDLLYVGNYKTLKDQFEPLYRVPTPDFYMPLSCDTNIYEGSGTSSFSRASAATYINKAGILTTAAIDEPRFEKEGLLMESASTNLVPRSIVDGKPLGWTVNGGVVTSNQASPDGGSNALKIVASTSDDGLYTDVGAQAKETTISIWLKGEVGGEQVKLGFNSTEGTAVLTTSWERFSFQMQPTTNKFYTVYPVSACTFYMFGAQVEALPFVSSYIPTNGSAVTRASDSLTLDSGGSAAKGYTQALEVILLRAVSPSPYKDFMRTNGVQFNFFRHTGERLVSHIDGSPDVVVNTVTANTPYKLCKSYDGVTGRTYLDGTSTTVRAQSLRVDAPATSTVLSGDMHIKNYRIWREVLTPEQVSTL